MGSFAEGPNRNIRPSVKGNYLTFRAIAGAVSGYPCKVTSGAVRKFAHKL